MAQSPSSSLKTSSTTEERTQIDVIKIRPKYLEVYNPKASILEPPNASPRFQLKQDLVFTSRTYI